MCNPSVPSVSLATAVLMQVQEFVQTGKQFSRYDVTKSLREKCNNGLLEIPEVENTTGGNPRYFIPKQAVDDIFEQLWRNCLANGLPSLTAAYNPSLGYRTFSVDPTTISAAPQTTPQVAPQVSTPPAVSSSPSVSYGTGPVIVSDAEIRRRVTVYMERCKGYNIVPSLKQVQSAIKRGNRSTGLSHTELANIVMSLGYKAV